MPDAAMRRLWGRIERVLRELAPETAATLAPPATDEQIAALEAAVGSTLPADLRASLKVHNGQRDPSRCHGFTGDGMLLGVGQIAAKWKTTTQLDAAMGRPSSPGHGPWWKASCIPFADAEGDMLCVDMDPRLGDEAGEVVCFVHDGVIERGLGAGFGDWLSTVAERLEGGRFRIDEYGLLSPDADG